MKESSELSTGTDTGVYIIQYVCSGVVNKRPFTDPEEAGKAYAAIYDDKKKMKYISGLKLINPDGEEVLVSSK